MVDQCEILGCGFDAIFDVDTGIKSWKMCAPHADTAQQIAEGLTVLEIATI